MTIITTIITWKRRRKRNETDFSLFDASLELSPLFERCDIFFPRFTEGPAVFVSILWIPRLSSVRLCFEWRYEERNLMETTRRYHYGHPSFRRWSWRGIRSEHLSSSRCIHPFIGFVNFATGYVITEQAKPRKSVERGRKGEKGGERGMKRGRKWRS